MELILLKRIEKLGNFGDIVKVKRGYGVNYLLPQKIALRATEANIAEFKAQKVHLEELNIKHKQEAQIVATALKDQMVVLIRQASESGHLYGSASAKDIAKAINNPNVNRAHVRLDKPIKEIGVHPVRLQLHPEVDAFIFLNVAKSEDEAKNQAAAAKEVVAESAAQRVE